jgi:hypothetical protein
MTGEHIWPAWLSKLLPKTRYRNERVDGEAKSTWMTTKLDQTANVVCKRCNETWMSELESQAKRLLADVIINGKRTTFGYDDLKFLAAYAFEKSVIANYQTLSILGEPISTRAQRERFRTSLELPPTSVSGYPHSRATRDIPAARIPGMREQRQTLRHSTTWTSTPISTSSAISSSRCSHIGSTASSIALSK